jgi:uncharacterized repeat protein (TIGR01451 family)
MLTLLRRLVFFLVYGFAASAMAGNDNIIWENQGLASGSVIPTGATLADSSNRVGAIVTQSTLISGGTFTTNLKFNSGTLGNHAGYGRLEINNNANDPNDKFTVTITFNQPVSNLQFSLLDIDLRSGSGTSDAVEIFYNGSNNVKASTFVSSIGGSVAPDDETYMDGYEGIATSAATSTAGNIILNFGATLITSVRFVFFTSDDSNANPFPQFIGISDLTYDVLADLVISKSDGVGNVLSGEATSYTITITNNGPNSADGAILKDATVAGLQFLDPITCAASPGATCPTLLNREVADLIGAGIIIPVLPSGSSMTFTLNALVTATGF